MTKLQALSKCKLSQQVATGVFEKLRPKGVMLLVTILEKVIAKLEDANPFGLNHRVNSTSEADQC